MGSSRADSRSKWSAEYRRLTKGISLKAIAQDLAKRMPSLSKALDAKGMEELTMEMGSLFMFADCGQFMSGILRKRIEALEDEIDELRKALAQK